MNLSFRQIRPSQNPRGNRDCKQVFVSDVPKYELRLKLLGSVYFVVNS